MRRQCGPPAASGERWLAQVVEPCCRWLCVRHLSAVLRARDGQCEIYQLTYNPQDKKTDVNSLGKMASVELLPGASIVLGGSFGLDAGYCLYYPEAGRLQFVFAYDLPNTAFYGPGFTVSHEQSNARQFQVIAVSERVEKCRAVRIVRILHHKLTMF